jgi:hypothetical protein
VDTKNSLVQVDRNSKPCLPIWLRGGLVYPDFSYNGPAEFDLRRLTFGRVGRTVQGTDFFVSLNKRQLLSKSLNLQDGEAILKKDLSLLKSVFLHHMMIPLWGSVGRSRSNGKLLYVPTLNLKENEYSLTWRCLQYSHKESLFIVVRRQE